MSAPLIKQDYFLTGFKPARAAVMAARSTGAPDIAGFAAATGEAGAFLVVAFTCSKNVCNAFRAGLKGVTCASASVTSFSSTARSPPAFCASIYALIAAIAGSAFFASFNAGIVYPLYCSAGISTAAATAPGSGGGGG
jgi:hypothetical protein